MAEFTKVMKQKVRMTRGCEINCLECNLDIKNNKMGLNCYRLLIDRPDVYEKIIMDWAKEHPAITNADKFKEIFGTTISLSFCPFLYQEKTCQDCSNCKYEDFWNQEYEESNIERYRVRTKYLNETELYE